MQFADTRYEEFPKAERGPLAGGNDQRGQVCCRGN
jgi:hypothetical protein